MATIKTLHKQQNQNLAEKDLKDNQNANICHM